MNDFIKPIIVLSLICLFVSGALAICNSFTQPVITKAAVERAEAARREIIPQTESFEIMETEDFRHEYGLPKSIADVYRATNGSGFIFTITTNGYGGEIKLICGINPEGKIIKTAALEHSETKGLATPVFEEPHSGQYRGRDKNGIDEIAAVSGATISSNAYKNGIRDAFAAYDIIMLHWEKTHWSNPALQTERNH